MIINTLFLYCGFGDCAMGKTVSVRGYADADWQDGYVEHKKGQLMRYFAR